MSVTNLQLEQRQAYQDGWNRSESHPMPEKKRPMMLPSHWGTPASPAFCQSLNPSYMIFPLSFPLRPPNGNEHTFLLFLGPGRSTHTLYMYLPGLAEAGMGFSPCASTTTRKTHVRQ